MEREFDYRVPDELSEGLIVGSRVRVPLHGRRVAGWVVAQDVEPPAGVRLLPIAARRGFGPDPELVTLAEWAAWRWAGRQSAFLHAASPPRFVYRLPAPGDRRAPRTGPEPSQGTGGDGSRLDDEVVARALTAGRAVVRLPPGSPRSGLVEALVARTSGSVLVLCAARADAERVSRLLSGRGTPVALLPEQWAEASAGGRVVVGVRAAAWGPVPGLAAVLVLDGHEEA
ncbi:MAG TPA: hypothetical protein VGR90_03035, partial [Acidimicrobiales bacterium]|nr:hypothetical protein [Acidimicrobiales bacterium]